MDEPQPPLPTRTALFLGFLQVGVSGFGGVLPFARRMLVETKAWLTPEEFNEVLALGQFLPGPNIVNVSVIIGRRFHGVAGSIVASVGLMFAPLVILLVLATLYAELAQYDVVRRAAHGVSVGAAGLILSMAFKMAHPLRKSSWRVAVALASFAAIGLARLPLVWVLAALGPVAFMLAWRYR